MEAAAIIWGSLCYDRHLIEEAAVCGGFKMEELEEADEMKANRFLFKVPAKCNPFTGYGKPMNDTLFVVQSQLIREYAKKGPCIIVGRCADKILEETEGLISLCPDGGAREGDYAALRDR